jgi:hypothetical protein
MKTNVGNIDRVLRALTGIALIAWAVLGGPVWAWVGIIPLATALFKFCPAYSLLGIRTCVNPIKSNNIE